MAPVPRTGLSPATARLSRRVPLPALLPRRPPYNPARASTPAVWAGPLSLAATRGVTLVFLSSDYWDVSVRRVRLRHAADAAPSRGGLPHSDTRGSEAARASPRTFAACRVLPRLREPRHPPCALARFLPAGDALTRPPDRSSRSLVYAFLPSCQRTAGHLARTRGECGARTHDPRLAKPVL